MKKFLFLLLFNICTANASESNETINGICFGAVLVGSSDYKIPASSWDKKALINFKKNSVLFNESTPKIKKCMQEKEDEISLNNCLNSLPSKAARDFMIGASKGMASSDNAFKKGGMEYVKMNAELICYDLK